MSQNYSPGHDVHPIQARKAMEDRASWRTATLVKVELDTVTIEIQDGEMVPFVCHRAPELKGALERGTPLGGETPTVILVERWRLLIVPLGRGGKEPPTRIRFLTGASSLDGGAATAGLSPDDGYDLLLFSIERVEPKPSLPTTGSE